MADSLVGREVGRFRIVSHLGAGGMGEVYAAQDTHLNRTVALKVLAPGSERDPHRAIRREAQALSKLNHPNIATVHDLVEVDGLTFVVMELIDGESLSARVSRGRLPVALVLDIARQVSAGLQAAHRAGIVHRDLKPSNLMLTPSGQIKIVDFGIAATIAGPDAVTTTTAIAPSVAGTLPYMAPEQITGGAVDARADIWALGVVLYELASGVRPFGAANQMLLADFIQHREPVPLALNVPDAPVELQHVVVKALSKDPAKRFQTVGELTAALDAVRSSHSAATGVMLRRPGIARLAIISAVVVALIVALAWRYWPGAGEAGVSGARLKILVGDLANHSDEPAFDDTVGELLTTSLGQSRFLTVYPRSRVPAVLARMKASPATIVDEKVGREICQREGIDALVTSNVTRLGNSFVLVVKVLAPNGDMRASASETFANPGDLPGRLDTIVKQVRAAIGEAPASVQATSTPLAEVTSSSIEAVRFYTQGLKRQRAGDASQAIVLFQKAIDVDSQFAMAQEALGLVYTNLQDFVKAEGFLKQAAAHVDRLPEAERHKILADYGMLRHDYEPACAHLQVLGELRPLDPAPFMALSNCKAFRLDYAGAIVEAKKGQAIEQSPLGLAILARLNFLSGDVAGAFAGANDLCAAAIAANRPAPFPALFVRARAELWLGKFDDALRSYDDMIALGEDQAIEGWLGKFDLARATGRIADAKAAIGALRGLTVRRGNVLATARVATVEAELELNLHGTSADVVKALTAMPSARVAGVIYLAGRTNARAGRLAEAEARVKEMNELALEAAPDRALSRLLAAEVALAKHQASLAVAAADEAYTLEPSTLAKETQAHVYVAAGKTAEAERAYQDLLKRSTERPEAPDAPGLHRVVQARYELAVLYDDAGDKASARPLLETLAATFAKTDGLDPRAGDVGRRLRK